MMTGLNEEVRVFSKSLFSLGQEKDALLEYSSNFADIVDILKSEEKLRLVFFSPRVSREEKNALFSRLFDKYFAKGFLAFLRVVISKRRQGLLEKIYEDFEFLLDDFNNVLRCRVIAARSLSDDTIAEIKRVLEHKFGKKVILSYIEIDPSILGGLIIELAGVRIDFSVLNNLTKLKDEILAIKLRGAI